MKTSLEYLERCIALQRKCCPDGTLPSGPAAPLLEFSLVRLTKVGMGCGDKAFWQEMQAELLSGLKNLSEEFAGETAGLKWPLHPGAAWLAARGIGDFSGGVIEAAERLVCEGHRNEEGLFDDPIYPGHLSTEIMAMTIPALAFAGKCSGNARFFEEAVRQYEGYASVLYDPAVRLWHPGYLPGKAAASMWRIWDKSPLSQELYLDETGVYPGCWSRGEGYALFALSELVFELPDSHAEKPELLKIREQMLESLLPYQDRNGMWHSVLNDWGSYPETSGTAWILYAMGRAIKRGTVDRSRYLIPYKKGLAGLGRYLAWDGSIFNVSNGCICPGGRGTAADYALQSWAKDGTQGFAPVILALQQAAQIERHTGLIPSYQTVFEQLPGDEK